MAVSNNAGYGRDYDQPLGLTGTGLLSNRNDIRQAMALRLLDNQVPASIPGKGATAAVALGGIAKAFAMGKLLSDSQDEKDQARADEATRRAEQADEARSFMGGSGAAPALAAPAAVAAIPAASPSSPGPVNVPDGFLDRLVGAESGGNPTASNPRSSARGAGQFINGTWLDLARRHEPDATAGKSDADVLAMRTDPALSRRMVGHYAADNGQALQQAGLAADPGNLSLAHMYGPGGATKLLQADPGALVSSTLGDGVIRANPELRGLTNKQAIGIHQQRMAGLNADVAPAADPAAIPVSSPGQPSGPLLAARMGQDGGDKGSAPAGTGPAMAARMTPETVAELEQKAARAAGSTNPLISRQAPMLAMQARTAGAQLERQDRDAQRSGDRADNLQQRAADRADAQGQRAADAAERQRLALDARVPNGYRWSADRSGMEFVPGGPADPKNAPAATVQPPPHIDTDQGRFLQNPDGSLGTRLGGLPRQAEVEKPMKPPSDTVTKGILGNITSLRNLDGALDAVDKNKGAFGMQNYLPSGLVQRMDSGGVDPRAQVANIGSMVLHERSGAAVTASEMPRLAPFIPAATDDAATVRTKLRGMRQRVQDMLQEQYDTYNPANGYRAVPGHARALGVDEGGGDALMPVPPAGGAPAAPAAAPPGSVPTSGPMPGAPEPVAPGARGKDQPWPVKSDADYQALPSGAMFTAPDGSTRRKP